MKILHHLDLVPYTSKYSRGKTFAVFVDFAKRECFTIENFPS